QRSRPRELACQCVRLLGWLLPICGTDRMQNALARPCFPRLLFLPYHSVSLAPAISPFWAGLIADAPENPFPPSSSSLFTQLFALLYLTLVSVACLHIQQGSMDF